MFGIVLSLELKSHYFQRPPEIYVHVSYDYISYSSIVLSIKLNKNGLVDKSSSYIYKLNRQLIKQL